MDHLPQPVDPVLPQIQIPYFCKDADVYDADNDFTSFPERHAWSKQKLRNLELEDRSPESALSILQSWLFFGTLKSIINVPFNFRDFLAFDENGQRIITTQILPDLIGRWKAATHGTEIEIRKYTPGQKIEKYQNLIQEARRIRLILEEANMALVSISYAAARNTIVPQSLLLSIEILLSGLSNSAIFMYGLEHMASVGSAASIDYKSLGMFTDWCPFMFERTRSILNSSALYYAGRAVHFGLPRLHNGCTTKKCQSERVDPKNYSTLHCCPETDCESEGPISAEVNRILDNDDYPILLFNEDAHESILADVIPAKEAPPYIAVSHVWAQGLGNPLENTMPKCQLRRLRRLMQDCMPQGRVAMWIDTLLCPIEGRYCDLAIAKMVPTYQNAQMVLVLDEGIVRASRSLPPTELLLHVASSMWMQRLWTLQEGALNRRVVLQLADGQYDYDEILRAVGDNRLVQTSYETVSRELLNACQTLRLNGIPERPGQNLDFALWINMLQCRKTSELRDESLCLATLLGHDLGTIVKLTPEERLMKIYEVQRIVPWNLIFLSHPKMATDGMKWAPRTYLEGGEGHGGTLISAPNHFKACFLPGSGLVIDLPSFNFHREERVTIPMMFQDSKTGFVYIVASASSQAEAEYTPATLSHWTGDFSLVFETRRDNNSGRSVMAVLVACAELIQPTPETSTALAPLENPSQSFRRMHYVQRLIVGLEPRFGRVAHTDDACHVVESTMPVQRVCVA